MSAPLPFGARLGFAMDDRGPLCVGIDPHPGLLERWGLPDDATGLREFAARTLDAVVDVAAAIKPQSAFFERHGSAGIAVLERLIAEARSAGLLTVLDAKRGDIGSTMAAYADAYLRDGAPLAVDALTVSPYLGFGSLEPAVQLARRTGRGLFVLALTSNPEGPSVQHARDASGEAVAAVVARAASELNGAEIDGRPADGPDGKAVKGSGARLGSFGLVVGATIGTAARELGIDLAAVRGPLLAPGVGAQGAGREELRAVFGDARSAVLASSSRAVLSAGPQVRDLRDAARRAVDDVTSGLR